MNIPKFRYRRQRVGVVGLYRSGKTVFLTSLINHLMNHDPKLFPLGDGQVRVSFLGEQEPGHFPKFPYLEYRNNIVNSSIWPVKTCGVTEYGFKYYRSDWKLSSGEMTLVDFPGERLCDLMMANLSYDQWSDLVIAIFRNHAEYREHTGAWLRLVDGTPVTEAEVLDSYLKLLYELYVNFLPVVTPSSVLLSPDGQWFGTLRPEEFLSKACLGLDKSKQFAPLPLAHRTKAPAMRGKFALNYDEYRQKVVQPLFNWMKNCDSLVVLVDVTSVLSSGLGMYQGNRELLTSLIQQLNPGRSYFGVSLDLLTTLLSPIHGPLNKLLDLNWHEISRVAFVATKADLVHQSDRLNMGDLLREMTQGLVAAHKEKAAKLAVRYFSCAAVNSTRSTDSGKLQGMHPVERNIVEYESSRVPKTWPEIWQAGEFCFPWVAPAISARRDLPPKHIGLNLIADFLMR